MSQRNFHDEAIAKSFHQGVVFAGTIRHHSPLSAHFYAMDAETGDEIWNYETGHNTDLRDVETGELIWQVGTLTNAGSGMTAFGGKLYLAGGSAGVIARDASNGQKMWEGKLLNGLRFMTAPALVPGIVD